ncbi:hypothetical protein FRACYDRAFT_258734 [Fragilariopsis cylindrus CCMP1102]|uniref:Uncharacterized protein n=1 Tax=Fragilariopsis cylindrus CCMP1102 TaxID=635003 RepID=A0A1E7EID7_9STRA|nr:hypothetical protein FRACYDRAFT_258734 [Fragilariopsis cylindrus CCMP1102]|eukprot:OEU05659.1 hypothetical protein FRACYDRAFT_258734 [Fragilariopsis cylindrus CCMP1102]
MNGGSSSKIKAGKWKTTRQGKTKGGGEEECRTDRTRIIQLDTPTKERVDGVPNKEGTERKSRSSKEVVRKRKESTTRPHHTEGFNKKDMDIWQMKWSSNRYGPRAKRMTLQNTVLDTGRDHAWLAARAKVVQKEK